ncbi:hypothetical protein Nepgr_015609 [Nepenthes gracilis]|uniref:Protein TIFY n=1 Tax=Nepenthes gracilis TaxID=150966 RepID=A0AAD3XQU8_NEPGR|nr:hypothetical protein Nepgr_015609 [Nepenthes gracilis]
MSSLSAVGNASWKTGHTSTFAQTYNLLSRYLKEKRSFGDLRPGTIDNVDAKGTNDAFRHTTMNLFPQEAGFGSFLNEEEIPSKTADSGNAASKEPQLGQMTIFYAGQVIVFNDFPAEKVKEIMELASRGSSQKFGNSGSNSAKFIVDSTNSVLTVGVTPTLTSPQMVQNSANNVSQKRTQQSPSLVGSSDLPIVRRNSLQRFFEKRKDRITARAPYSTNHSASTSSKPTESKPWLGLAASP